MRIAFVRTLFKEAMRNENIMLLTADLGFSVFEEYIETLPTQYLNVGVAEQNMTGMSAGMAMEGKIPFIYSIVPFVTMRNFEQIRNDICYQNLNVKIVGVGAGFSYGPYGHTHHGLEDIGILRTLANLTIFSPGDPVETELVVKESLRIKGPVYIRLGRAGEPKIHINKPSFKMGKGILIEEGKDVTIFATGTMLYTAFQVTQELLKSNIRSCLVSIPTLKPLDVDIVLNAARKTKAIFTIEEHSLVGGLGSGVAEILAENAVGIPFKRFGVPDHFTKVIGNQEYMRKANGLGVGQITKKILTLWKI